MANVIRQDVIEVSINAKDDALTKLNSGMDKLKSAATGAAGGGIDKLTSGFDKMKQSAGKSEDSIDNLKESIGDVGKGSGLDDVAKDADGLKGSLDGTSKSAKKSHGTLKAFAKVSLLSLGKGLDTVLTKLTHIAAKAGGAAFNGLKKMASVSFKALSVGLIAAATAIGAIVAKSVSAYADYEQLVGGVDTLFKGSSGTIQKYANDAYKTAGLSANAYMETVTGFSASLIQSLGGDTEKAASYANMAVTDMAD